MCADLNVQKAPENIDKRLKVGGQKDPKTGNVVTALRDFIYSPHVYCQLFLVTKREISIYDLELKQVCCFFLNVLKQTL